MSAAPVAGVSTGGTSRAPLRATFKERGSACADPHQPNPARQAVTINAQRVTAKFIFASCRPKKSRQSYATMGGAYPSLDGVPSLLWARRACHTRRSGRQGPTKQGE